MVQHKAITDDPRERVARIAGDGGRHEVVVGSGEERDLGGRGASQVVGVAASPILVDDGPGTQVADTAAAPPQEPAESARLGQLHQPGAAEMDELLQRRSEVQGAQRDGGPHQTDPTVAGAEAVVGGAASHEPTHRVAQEVDRFDGHRPPAHEVVDQLGDIAPVGRMWRPVLYRRNTVVTPERSRLSA